MTVTPNNLDNSPIEDGRGDVVTIQSPARLHFGLIEVCAGENRLFGGLGAMIQQPATVMSLKVYPSDSHAKTSSCMIDADEPWRSRIESVVKRWLIANPNPIFPPLQIRLDNRPRMHAGLGSGTQIACATVSLLNRWCQNQSTLDCGKTSVEALSNITQRGKRSFVGLAGHLKGGFIVDCGQLSSDSLRQIERIAIPEDWRVVLAKPLSTATISGVVENDYFGQSQIPNPHRESMWSRIQDEIVPALRAGNLNQFGSALYEYGRDAGRVFARVQGGIYRDQIVASLIEWIRAQGVTATGQTSWGPTVFAIVRGEAEAEDLLRQLTDRFPVGVEAMTTPFNHSGYRIS